MKYLTIKKVALGLVVAGYVASSAVATVTSITKLPIKGRAPLVNAKSTTESFDINSVDVAVTKANGTALTATEQWATGNIVVLKFNTVDIDGDKDPNLALTGNTVYFSYYIPGDNGTEGVWTQSVGQTQANGTVQWIIPSKAIKATKIAFAIRPTTEFGIPSQNNWVTGDIKNNKASGDGGDGDKSTDPKPDDGTGGGETPDSNGPVIPGDSFKATIYEVVAGAGAGEYALGTDMTETNPDAPNPVIGKTYTVQVMDDTTDSTSNFTYEWFLEGSYEGVPAAATTPLTTAQGVTGTATNQTRAITLGVNSAYGTTYLAGAQGYKLNVVATPK